MGFTELRAQAKKAAPQGLAVAWAADPRCLKPAEGTSRGPYRARRAHRARKGHFRSSGSGRDGYFRLDH